MLTNCGLSGGTCSCKGTPSARSTERRAVDPESGGSSFGSPVHPVVPIATNAIKLRSIARRDAGRIGTGSLATCRWDLPRALSRPGSVTSGARSTGKGPRSAVNGMERSNGRRQEPAPLIADIAGFDVTSGQDEIGLGLGTDLVRSRGQGPRWRRRSQRAASGLCSSAAGAGRLA